MNKKVSKFQLNHGMCFNGFAIWLRTHSSIIQRNMYIFDVNLIALFAFVNFGNEAYHRHNTLLYLAGSAMHRGDHYITRNSDKSIKPTTFDHHNRSCYDYYRYANLSRFPHKQQQQHREEDKKNCISQSLAIFALIIDTKRKATKKTQPNSQRQELSVFQQSTERKQSEQKQTKYRIDFYHRSVQLMNSPK